jgi:hypothetical protein
MEALNTPQPCAVPAEAFTALANSDFADAFEADLPGKLTALEASRKVVASVPRWVVPLLALRDILVKPFGLISTENTTGEKIGFFPLLSATEHSAVLGLDDKHLDFRLVVSVRPATGDQTQVTVSTLLKRHNLLGKLYLAVVLPFHRRIVPAFIKGAQRV